MTLPQDIQGCGGLITILAPEICAAILAIAPGGF
jgi:hypothetical protein